MTTEKNKAEKTGPARFTMLVPLEGASDGIVCEGDVCAVPAPPAEQARKTTAPKPAPAK